MRTQINKIYTASVNEGRSDVYRRFRKLFDLIAHADNPALERQEFQDWYVHNISIEQQLQFAMNESVSDEVRFFLGHTGIGKSTLLRFVCNTDKSQYSSVTKSLLIFLSCNPTLVSSPESWRNTFSANLAAASNLIEEKECVKIKTIELGNFIASNKRDLLFRPNAPLECTLTERTNLLRSVDRRAFELEKIKYISDKVKLKQLVIILDDIESLPHSIQTQAINELFHAFECLQNHEKRKYRITLVIALRPDTFMTAEHECNLTPYAYQTINLDEPVELGALFETRFKSARSKVDLSNIAKPEDWEHSKDVMMMIVDRLKIKFGKSLVALENHNIRHAISTFRLILENRRWFQRKAETHASFQIREHEYAVNDAGVLRAIMMNSGDMYLDCNDTPIANLLHNIVIPESDLIVSYIIRYLLERIRSESAIIWAPVGLNDLLKNVRLLMPNDVAKVDLWEGAIKWMVRRKLLFKLNPQDNEDKRYSLTPRTVEIWDLISKNSVLFQAFREDAFRDMRELDYFNRKNVNLEIEKVFEDCINWGIEIANKEKEHLSTSETRSNLKLMRQTFGSEFISLKIIRGIDSSFDQFYGMKPPEILLNHLNTFRNNVNSLCEKYS